MSNKFFTRFDFASHQPEFYHSVYKTIGRIRKKLSSLATELPNPLEIPVIKLLEESTENVSMTESLSERSKQDPELTSGNGSDEHVSNYYSSRSCDYSSKQCVENIFKNTAQDESENKGKNILNKANFY